MLWINKGAESIFWECYKIQLSLQNKKVASAWAEYEQTKEGVKYLAYLTPQIMNVKAM